MSTREEILHASKKELNRILGDPSFRIGFTTGDEELRESVTKTDLTTAADVIKFAEELQNFRPKDNKFLGRKQNIPAYAERWDCNASDGRDKYINVREKLGLSCGFLHFFHKDSGEKLAEALTQYL